MGVVCAMSRDRILTRSRDKSSRASQHRCGYVSLYLLYYGERLSTRREKLPRCLPFWKLLVAAPGLILPFLSVVCLFCLSGERRPSERCLAELSGYRTIRFPLPLQKDGHRSVPAPMAFQSSNAGTAHTRGSSAGPSERFPPPLSSSPLLFTYFFAIRYWYYITASR